MIEGRGWQTTVGNEGGFAPPVISNEEPLQLLLVAIEEAGYVPGEDVALALDLAASELYENGRYHLAKDGLELTSEELVDLLVDLTERYPILSIEDGLAQEDWDGFALLKRKTENHIQIVGDDLFATNAARVRIGVAKGAANSALVKANQVGTITEALDTIRLAREYGLTAIVSHRSGDTELPFEACFAVGTGVGQIKTGSMSRAERVRRVQSTDASRETPGGPGRLPLRRVRRGQAVGGWGPNSLAAPASVVLARGDKCPRPPCQAAPSARDCPPTGHHGQDFT